MDYNEGASAAYAHRKRAPQHGHNGNSITGETGLEGSFQQMKLQNCLYFLRTGTCAFGAKCRFNHSTTDKMQSASDSAEELPERPGQAECQFYMKTGICKYGPACLFHHPRPKDQSSGTANSHVQLNFLGLPLRPGEKECAYYVQTGSCKFGGMCRFHHPQPLSTEIASSALTASPPYAPQSSIVMRPMHRPAPALSLHYTPPSSIAMPPMHFPVSAASPPYMPPSSIAMPATSSYQDGPVPGAPFMRPGPGMPRPVSFMPVLVSSPQPAESMPHMPQQQGIPPTVKGPQAIQPTQNVYTNAQRPFDANDANMNGPYPHQVPRFPASSSQGPATSFSSQGSAMFPERPGQPDCHHYMKTGDCKFGATCKYHHPKDHAMSLPVGLNPMGLPLWPGKPSCPYYVRHRICKFGPVCKFDHPILAYSPSQSSINDMLVGPFAPESSASPASHASALLGEHHTKLEKVQHLPPSDGADGQ